MANAVGGHRLYFDTAGSLSGTWTVTGILVHNAADETDLKIEFDGEEIIQRAMTAAETWEPHIFSAPKGVTKIEITDLPTGCIVYVILA